MTKTQRIILAALPMLPLAAPAYATVVFTDNNSQLQASALASVGNPFNFQLDNPAPLQFTETAVPSSFGDTLTANASLSDNDGPSTANLSTMIGVDISQTGPTVTVEMDLNYAGSQTASPGSAADDFDRANAEGSALIELIFNLDQDYNYSFDAPGAQASGSSRLELRFDLAGGGEAFDVSLDNQAQDLGFNGVLPAGNGYKIVINVNDSNNLGSADGSSATSLADFSDAKLVLTPVPEPTSAILLGMGGLLLTRRRRR